MKFAYVVTFVFFHLTHWIRQLLKSSSEDSKLQTDKEWLRFTLQIIMNLKYGVWAVVSRMFISTALNISNVIILV